MQVPSLSKIKHERVAGDWTLSVEENSGTSTFKTSNDPYQIKIKKLVSGNYDVDVVKLTATSPADHWVEVNFVTERDPTFTFLEVDFNGQDVAALRIGIDDVILHCKFYDEPVTGTLKEVYLYCPEKINLTAYNIGHQKI